MKKQTRFATQYNHGRDISALFATVNNEPTMTQQSDKDDCDINIIMKKYGHGAFPQVTAQPMYGDFSQGLDYTEARQAILRADEAFHEIPAEIRQHFDNDAAKFIDFTQDPKNLPKLREWGLAKREETPLQEPPAQPGEPPGITHPPGSGNPDPKVQPTS